MARDLWRIRAHYCAVCGVLPRTLFQAACEVPTLAVIYHCGSRYCHAKAQLLADARATEAVSHA